MKTLIHNRVPATLALLCILGLMVFSYGLSSLQNSAENLESRRIILYFTDTGEAVYGEAPEEASNNA